MIVSPDGIVKGGFLNFSLSETGKVSYKGNISIKVGTSALAKDFEGSLVLQPEAVKSETYKTLGEKIIGKLKINVLELQGTQSIVKFVYNEDQVARAKVTTTKNLVELNWLDSKFASFGLCLSVKFQP